MSSYCFQRPKVLSLFTFFSVGHSQRGFFGRSALVMHSPSLFNSGQTKFFLPPSLVGPGRAKGFLGFPPNFTSSQFGCPTSILQVQDVVLHPSIHPSRGSNWFLWFVPVLPWSICHSWTLGLLDCIHPQLGPIFFWHLFVSLVRYSIIEVALPLLGSWFGFPPQPAFGQKRHVSHHF